MILYCKYSLLIHFRDDLRNAVEPVVILYDPLGTALRESARFEPHNRQNVRLRRSSSFLSVPGNA